MDKRKQVIKYVKKLHRKNTETFTEYKNDVKVFLSRLGYDADVFVIFEHIAWHLVIYERGTNTLIGVVRVEMKSNHFCKTTDIKLYTKE